MRIFYVGAGLLLGTLYTHSFSHAAFNLVGNKLAEAILIKPSGFSSGDPMNVQFVIPLPRGTYEGLLQSSTQWLGIRDPGNTSETLPLSLRPLKRAPDGVVLTVVASTTITIPTGPMGSEVKISVKEGNFSTVNQKNLALAPKIPPILHGLQREKIFVVAWDVFGNVYLTDVYDEDPNENKRRLIHAGHDRLEGFGYTIMKPIVPVDQSTGTPTLRKMLGVGYHLVYTHDGFAETTLRFDNSSANVSGTVWDQPVGDIFIKRLAVVIPDPVRRAERFDWPLSDLDNCEPAVIQTPPQQLSITISKPNHVMCDIVKERSDGKVHPFHFGKTVTYSFALGLPGKDPSGSKTETVARLGRQAFIQPGTNGAGEELFSPWNPLTAWMGLGAWPKFDHIGGGDPQASRQILRNADTQHFNSLHDDFRDGTNYSGEFASNYPGNAFPTTLDAYGGLTSGRHVYFSTADAMRTMYAASPDGLKALYIYFHGAQNRSRHANYGLDGFPVSLINYYNGTNIGGGYFKPGPITNYLDCNQVDAEYQPICQKVERYSGNHGGSMVIDPNQNHPMGYNGQDKFGFHDRFDPNSHFQQIYVLTFDRDAHSNQEPVQPHDRQHFIRGGKDAEALTEITGRWPVQQEFSSVAVHAHHDYSHLPYGNGQSSLNVPSTPDRGMYFGRGRSESTYLMASYYGYGDDNYRAQTMPFFNKLVDAHEVAQTCTGMIHRGLNENKMIDGNMDGSPFDEEFTSAQWFEVEYLASAHEMVMTNVFKGTNNPREANLLQVMDRHLADGFAGDINWNSSNGINSAEGYYYYVAVTPSNAWGNPTGPAFCAKPSPGNQGYPANPSVMPMDYYHRICASHEWQEPDCGPPYYGTSTRQLSNYYSANIMYYTIRHLQNTNPSAVADMECRIQKNQGGGSFNSLVSYFTTWHRGSSSYNLANNSYALRWLQDRMDQGETNFCN